MSKWREREAEIRSLAAEGKSDEEIARRYGVTKQSVYLARKQFGIPSGRPQGEKGWDKPEPIPTTSYVDAEGNKVTLCPPRHAVSMQPYTARPSVRNRTPS